LLRRTNSAHADGAPSKKKEKHMTFITRIASVAIGVMTQTIFVGILIGA
jgi:hypothetical protein